MAHNFLDAVAQCLPCVMSADTGAQTEKQPLLAGSISTNTLINDAKSVQTAAERAVTVLVNVDSLPCVDNHYSTIAALKSDIEMAVGASSWSEDLAKAVVETLTLVIENGTKDMSDDFKKLAETASYFAHDIFYFAKKHPMATNVMATIMAIGILHILAPWALGVLGFGTEGPVPESFASWWQGQYLGYVPAGCWHLYIQELIIAIGRG